MATLNKWEQYVQYRYDCPMVGFSIDPSRMGFGAEYYQRMKDPMDKAFLAMADLEAGEIANPDEKRMVGHYWLRNTELAPDINLTREIETTAARIRVFAAKVHVGEIAPPAGAHGGVFKHFIVVGIGGSALGPQFVGDALGTAQDKMTAHFIDNTDPDGIDRLVDRLGDELDKTLAIVISKSGGTVETRNGMIEIQHVYQRHGIRFAPRAVAVTCPGSALDKLAQQEKWLATFPMWDWVGGRTSQLSAVGLLPAALQGIDLDGLLNGARQMDKLTRLRDLQINPAAILALSWYYATEGRARKAMVVLPYKDRLALFAKYLQQLVMESLGKELNLKGEVVHQGLTVYGNKGSTDQHAYIQQLREGPNDFFVTFIKVLADRDGAPLMVEDGVTSGDYLHGFLEGTREALTEKDRQSLTITIPRVDGHSVGALIALYERAVGFYASLVNINAYHQPGVEAGKKAAAAVIAIQRKVQAHLLQNPDKVFTAPELAAQLTITEHTETVFKILEHLGADAQRGVMVVPGKTPVDNQYGFKAKK